jgi:hypothetical protein
MRKGTAFLFIAVFLGAAFPSFALDPVAPREERAFGFLRVETPLPATDECEVSAVAPASGYKKAFKPGQTMKIPVGDYLLSVKLQDRVWKNPISIRATELTALVVPGFGNLKVTSPRRSDTVEVYSPKGGFVTSFPASQVKTLPVGRYHVKVKMKSLETPRIQVAIVTNTTREVVASEGKPPKIVAAPSGPKK